MRYIFPLIVLVTTVVFIITLMVVVSDANACVVSQVRIHNTRYVYHDLDCNGTIDMVYVYDWNGNRFIFSGSHPYTATK